MVGGVVRRLDVVSLASGFALATVDTIIMVDTMVRHGLLLSDFALVYHQLAQCQEFYAILTKL